MKGIEGLLLIVVTGLAWGGIGIVMGQVARRQLNVFVFMTTATTLAAIAAWSFLIYWPSLLSGQEQRGLPLILVLSIAGITGTFGMLFLQKAMTIGAAGWTVGQSAMVIPFLMGILFLGEPLRLHGSFGLAAILISLIAFARNNQQSGNAPSVNQRWFGHAFLALLLLGTQQTLSSIPSSWEGWSDTARLRVPVILLAGALPMVIICAYRRLWPGRVIWLLAAFYATLVVVGQLLLFSAMDRLFHEGRLAIAFPVAIGISMVVVALYDIVVWKNRLNGYTLTGIACGLLGVILLACSSL